MSGAGTVFPRDARQIACDALVERLEELRLEANGIRDSMFEPNIENIDDLPAQPYRPRLDQLRLVLNATDSVLAAHLPRPKHRIVQALELVERALADAFFRLPTTTRGNRDALHDLLRDAITALGFHLDRARPLARETYPGFPAIPGRATTMTRREAIAAATRMVTHLDRFAKAIGDVKALEGEPSPFEREGDLVRGFAGRPRAASRRRGEPTCKFDSSRVRSMLAPTRHRT